jgi:hypothetical protein
LAPSRYARPGTTVLVPDRLAQWETRGPHRKAPRPSMSPSPACSRDRRGRGQIITDQPGPARHRQPARAVVVRSDHQLISRSGQTSRPARAARSDHHRSAGSCPTSPAGPSGGGAVRPSANQPVRPDIPARAVWRGQTISQSAGPARHPNRPGRCGPVRPSANQPVRPDIPARAVARQTINQSAGPARHTNRPMRWWARSHHQPISRSGRDIASARARGS